MTKDKMLYILERFEKNFEYAKSGMVYPTLHLKDRSLLIDIYNKLKGEKVKIPVACSRCILPYIKELSAWYYQEMNDLKRPQESPEPESISEIDSQPQESPEPESIPEIDSQPQESPEPESIPEIDSQPQESPEPESKETEKAENEKKTRKPRKSRVKKEVVL